MSGSTWGAGTAVTAGEVPQLKVVSGRHSDTQKRPVRSGAPWLTRRRCSTTQALPFVYPPSKSLCFTPGGRGRAYRTCVHFGGQSYILHHRSLVRASALGTMQMPVFKIEYTYRPGQRPALPATASAFFPIVFPGIRVSVERRPGSAPLAGAHGNTTACGVGWCMPGLVGCRTK